MNEKVFIICIELNNKVSIIKFESLLNQLGPWKMVIPNVYVIRRDYSLTSEVIRQEIFGKFTNQCKLFIMKSSIDASWNLTTDVDSWLKMFI